jgi:hypothetical protein
VTDSSALDHTRPPATSGWDVQAIRAGGGVCVVFAVIPQVIAQLLPDDSGVALLLRLLALAGFGLGAGIAAWVQQRGLPLKHGLVTAIGTFVLVQLAFIVGRGVLGDDLRLGNLIANLPLVVGVGLFGGFLGSWMQRSGIRPGTMRRLRDEVESGRGPSTESSPNSRTTGDDGADRA